MRIEITARSFDLSSSMKDYIEKRVNKLKRYFDRVMESHVILTMERFIYRSEITLHGNGFNLFAEAKAEDPYVAFDGAYSKMERQVRRLKEKVRKRKGRKAGFQAPEIETEEEAIEEYEES